MGNPADNYVHPVVPLPPPMVYAEQVSGSVGEGGGGNDPIAAVASPPANNNNNNNQQRARVGWAVAAVVIIILIIAVVVGILVIPSSRSRSGGSKEVKDDDHLVVLASHNTKQLWMNEMMESFNAARVPFTNTAGQTRYARVQVCHTGAAFVRDPCGGTADTTTTTTMPSASMWSPPNTVWVQRDYLEATEAGRQTLVPNPEVCSATTNIPIGIAMWRDMAISLGWPTASLGWEDLRRLQQRGWSVVPTADTAAWGTDFLYGHGHPALSNSGSLSWVSAVHSFAQVPFDRQLTDVEIFSTVVQNQTSALASTVAHMGKIDTDILDRMVERGEAYLHAVANYESNVIRYNTILEEKGKPNRFVLIYPKEGTFWQEHPVCILDGPDWVSSDDQAASRLFVDYISQPEQQSKLCKYGIRPYSSEAANAPTCLGVDPFTDDNGVIPGITTADVSPIVEPSPRVVENVVKMWSDNRKPVKWILVLDQSGSMGVDNKIGLLRKAALSFVNQMLDRDHLGIITFNTQVTTGLTLDRRLGESRVQAKQQIEQLEAFGETALRPAVIQALDMMNPVIDNDRSSGGFNETSFNYGVLVLTDGDDTSTRSVDDVYLRLPEGLASSELHIFSVVLGTGLTDEDDLFMQEIASRTNGKRFNNVSDGSDLELTFTLIHAEL